MFAGHVGIGLAVGRAERRVNVGVFVAAAVLLDLVLWPLILLGWESVNIPASFRTTHQPEFDFPYSHGLLAAVLWSALAGALALLGYSRLPDARWRVAGLVAAAVFSHWLLDALVHRPELRLAGNTSPAIGLGLWDKMPVALALESAIVAVGMVLFLRGSGLSRGRRVAMVALCVVILAFTIMGMTVAPPPASVRAMAMSSLFALAAVVALAAYLGRQH
jgi:hypothetical protein